MGTYKRSSKGIVDEKGNIVKSFMIPSNDVQGQVSMEFNSENDVSIISSEAEKEPILEESGLPASIEKNEMTLWDEAEFYDNFEDNAKEALQMLLSVQSNENPNKKGGEDIGFRCDSIIFKNRQQYSVTENTIFDIITGYISSYPDNKSYKIYIKDIAKYIGYNDKNYIYRVFKKDFDKLKKKPLLIEIPGKEEGADPMEIQWWLLFDYNSAEDCKKKGMNDNAHIVIVPTPFFKILTLSSTIMHGAHYSIEISSSIKGKYARNLYYILESRKNYKAYPNAMPGVFTLTLVELRELVDYPTTYRPTDVRRRILDEARDEINNIPNTDIQFDYELLKTGKSFTGVRFMIKNILKLKEQEINAIEEKDSRDTVVVGILKGFGFSDKDIDQIYEDYVKTDCNIQQLTTFLSKTFSNEKVKHKASYLCKLMENGLYSENNESDSVPSKKNVFVNFEQRENDYDEMERALLGKSI